MISNGLSQKIYSQLINGKVINKNSYIEKSNELVENPLYTEISTHFDDYRQLYQRINFELVHKGGRFYFIRELNGSDANEVAIKIQALLIIIGRIITEKGYLFDVLTDYRAGVKLEDLSSAMSEARYTDILHTCKLCTQQRSIEDEMNNHLITRGILFKNSRGHYVLSDAGAVFFSELTEVL